MHVLKWDRQVMALYWESKSLSAKREVLPNEGNITPFQYMVSRGHSRPHLED